MCCDEPCRIIVTTFPFGDPDPKPLDQLEGFDVTYNEVGRKYSPEEHHAVLKVRNPHIIIAGTEKYTAEVLDLCPALRMISRVGIGVDSVDLDECEKRGIIVCNTPDAPSNAVAELTVCQMINALRRVSIVDSIIRNDGWERFIGRELRDCDVGIIGFGRIGTLVAQKMWGLKPRRVFINDIVQEKCKDIQRCEYATKSQIMYHCDIITLHIPYNSENHHFISEDDLRLMKDGVVLINTSRGGIVDENALYNWLKRKPNATAAVDTFVKEPYKDLLIELPNCLLTPHLGSCTRKSRFGMEVGATEEAMNFLRGKPFNSRIR